MYTLIGTAKLNDIDSQAWLADVIARISDMPVSRPHELLPWNWKPADNTEGRIAAVLAACLPCGPDIRSSC